MPGTVTSMSADLPLSTTERTTLHRLRERGRTDRADLYAVASVKVRTGPPKDDPEDCDTEIWAGVEPARLTFGAAEPDPALRTGVSIPDHISALAGHARDA